MCKYSLEGYASRNARQGETLTANVHEASGHGVFTSQDDMRDRNNHRPLVCVREGQKLTIEDLQITSRPIYTHSRYGLRSVPNEYIGQRHVVSVEDGRSNVSSIDMVKFDCGLRIPIAHLKSGMLAYVGIKPTLDEKLGVDEKALAVARLDIDPNPKPDDGDKPAEPKPEPKPEPASRRIDRTVNMRIGARDVEYSND